MNIRFTNQLFILFLFIFVIFFTSCEKKVFTPKIKHKTEDEYFNESLKETNDLIDKIKDEKNENEKNENLQIKKTANMEIVSVNKILVEKAMKLKKEGKYQRALKILLDLLREDSKNISILENISELYASLNNFTQSKLYAEKILELNDKNIFALTIIANFYAKNNEIEKAIATYIKLSQISPNDILYHNIGVLYEKQNKLRKAFEYYKKAVRLRGSEKGYYTLALLSIKLNDKENTIKYLEKAVKRGGSIKIKRILAEEYLKQKNYKNAKLIYSQISKKTNNSDDYNNLASVYLLESKYMDAEMVYLNALKISPNDQKLLHNLVLCYYKMKDPIKMEKAIKDYEKNNASLSEIRKLKVYLSNISK